MNNFNYDFIVAIHEYFQRIREIKIKWAFINDMERAFFNYNDDDKAMIMNDILIIYNKTHNKEFNSKEKSNGQTTDRVI